MLGVLGRALHGAMHRLLELGVRAAEMGLQFLGHLCHGVLLYTADGWLGADSIRPGGGLTPLSGLYVEVLRVKKIAVGDLGEFWYGDYKEPFEQLEGAVPGYPVGVVLKDDAGLLLCAWCGKVYKNLGAHSAKTHGMSANQYKDEAGLLRKSALVSEQTRMMNSAQGFRLRAAGIFRTPTLEDSRRAAWQGGSAVANRERPAEALNKTGRTPLHCRCGRPVLERRWACYSGRG